MYFFAVVNVPQFAIHMRAYHAPPPPAAIVMSRVVSLAKLILKAVGQI